MAWVSGQARAKHQRGGRPAARESDRRLDGKHAPWSFPNPPLPWGDQPEPCAPTARPRGPFRQSGGQGPPSKSTRYHGSLPAKREWETGRLPFRREAQPVPLGARGGRGGTEHPSARLDALSPGGRNRRASETVGGPPPTWKSARRPPTAAAPTALSASPASVHTCHGGRSHDRNTADTPALSTPNGSTRDFVRYLRHSAACLRRLTPGRTAETVCPHRSSERVPPAVRPLPCVRKLPLVARHESRQGSHSDVAESGSSSTKSISKRRRPGQSASG